MQNHKKSWTENELKICAKEAEKCYATDMNNKRLEILAKRLGRSTGSVRQKVSLLRQAYHIAKIKH
jgi:Cdc6-like AAA superfamily ATPase